MDTPYNKEQTMGTRVNATTKAEIIVSMQTAEVCTETRINEILLDIEQKINEFPFEFPEGIIGVVRVHIESSEIGG